MKIISSKVILPWWKSAAIVIWRGQKHSSCWMSSWDFGHDGKTKRPVWSEEWKQLGLGAQLVDSPRFPPNLFFVQMGFGVDQHGKSQDATKAAVRAVRNAIEFNSIPGVISRLPGGRKNMLIHVKLGVPRLLPSPVGLVEKDELRHVDVWEVAKVFPYGKLLPIEMEVGGLAFPTGRVVEELGDEDDVGICVAACVTLGYMDDGTGANEKAQHKIFNTSDGY
jgi:uncharacterized protein (TIGR02058 family)